MSLEDRVFEGGSAVAVRAGGFFWFVLGIVPKRTEMHRFVGAFVFGVWFICSVNESVRGV
jgi:hypothetical protein